MNPRTVRLRRSRPSALSLALALMLTMFFVYMASLSAVPTEAADAAVQPTSAAELRMEGLEVAFACAGRYENLLEARMQASRCTQDGSAGLIIPDGDRFAVISEALPPDKADDGSILRSCSGLTLKTTGPAGDIAALSDMLSFLRSQVSETGALAEALESGNTDTNAVCALLDIYRSRGQRALSALQAAAASDAVAARLVSAGEKALQNIESAAESPDTGSLRLIHAAACAEWMDIIDDFTQKEAQTTEA